MSDKTILLRLLLDLLLAGDRNAEEQIVILFDAVRDELGIEIAELRAENARLRERVTELVNQTNVEFAPYREIVKLATAESNKTSAELVKAINILNGIMKIADEYYAFGLSGFDGEYTRAIAYLKDKWINNDLPRQWSHEEPK